MLWVFFFITWNEQKRTKAQSCAYKTLHKCHQTKQIHIEKTKYNDKKKSQILKNVTNKKTKLQIKFTVWIGLLPPEDTSDLDQNEAIFQVTKMKQHSLWGTVSMHETKTRVRKNHKQSKKCWCLWTTTRKKSISNQTCTKWNNIPGHQNETTFLVRHSKHAWKKKQYSRSPKWNNIPCETQ